MADETGPLNPLQLIKRKMLGDNLITPRDFDTWLAPTYFVSNGGDRMAMRVPNREFREWIHHKFESVIVQTGVGLGYRIEGLDYVLETPEPSATLAERPEPSVAAPKKFRSCPAIPEDAWYGTAKDYRKAMAEQPHSSDAPANFHLASFLSALSIGLNSLIFFRNPSPVFTNLFVVFVGQSNARKGWAQDNAITLAEEAGASFGRIEALASASGLISTMKMRLSQAAKNKKSFSAMIIQLDEMRILVETVNQKSSGTLVPQLTRLYDGKSRFEIPTRHDYTEVEDVPPGILLAGSVPEWMEGLHEKDLYGGLGNRILFFPGEKRGYQDDAWPADLSPFVRHMKTVFSYWRERGHSEIQRSEEAKRMFRAWGKEREIVKDRLVSTMADRHDAYILKVAALWAAFDLSDQILPAHMAAGIALSRYWLESLYFLFGRFGLSPIGRLEERMIEMVADTPSKQVRSRELIGHFSHGKCDYWTIRRALENVAGRHVDNDDWDGPLRLVRRGRKVFVTVNED